MNTDTDSSSSSGSDSSDSSKESSESLSLDNDLVKHNAQDFGSRCAAKDFGSNLETARQYGCLQQVKKEMLNFELLIVIVSAVD